MAHGTSPEMHDEHDAAPGDENLNVHEAGGGVVGYTIGLGLAAFLTAASFFAATNDLVWPPATVPLLVTFAIAQMGVHLVFFLHITSGPDNTNNILALAFGVLVVALVVLGSIWIMAHLEHNTMPMNELMQHQR